MLAHRRLRRNLCWVTKSGVGHTRKLRTKTQRLCCPPLAEERRPMRRTRSVIAYTTSALLARFRASLSQLLPTTRRADPRG